jgi:hypothetical protein
MAADRATDGQIGVYIGRFLKGEKALPVGQPALTVQS